jgi:hypothetical protein
MIGRGPLRKPLEPKGKVINTGVSRVLCALDHPDFTTIWFLQVESRLSSVLALLRSVAKRMSIRQSRNPSLQQPRVSLSAFQADYRIFGPVCDGHGIQIGACGLDSVIEAVRIKEDPGRSFPYGEVDILRHVSDQFDRHSMRRVCS